MIEDELGLSRSSMKQIAGMLVITAATALACGHALRQPTQMGANDISRWCTVWSLLERGSFAIDECPWQIETQDKVFRASGWDRAPAEGGAPRPHYYSSKPALLPILIAGVLYPARLATGVPLDRVVLQERAPRWTQKPDPASPYKIKGVLETPAEPVRWPAHIFYFKPIILLFNVIPFGIFLLLFTRVVDRHADSHWIWFFCLISASFGTYLLPFTQTLNNHTIAAFSAFFAIYQFIWIWDEGDRRGWRFATAGFFAAFAAANELPALGFLVLIGCMLAMRAFRQTLLYFIPLATLPVVGVAAAQYAALGEFKLAYESFGTEAYLYEGSLWKTPLDLDAFNNHPESHAIYFFHMTFGHHGIFSLTPIFIFSALGAARLLAGGDRLRAALSALPLLAVLGFAGVYACDPAAWKPGAALHPLAWVLWLIPGLLAFFALLTAIPLLRGDGAPLSALAWLTTVLTFVVLAFYTWFPKARNYGGSAQGLRWLFWLIPFWLLLLPKGLETGQTRPGVRKLALAALAISIVSVGYAMRNPWSHPWILDALEHLNLYPLTR
jgi:hypothetical protein